MKKLLSVLLLLPIITLAQKIRINEYDKFIKQQRVESHPLSITNSPDTKLSVCFSAEGSNLYVQLIGAGTGAHRIDPEDAVIFLMDNDSTITVKSRGPQGFDIGATASTYKHHYILTYADLKKLSQNNLAALRKYHSLEYDDVSVPKEVSAKFKTLCALFIVELVNSNLLHLVEAKDAPKAPPQARPTTAARVPSADTAAKTKATPVANVKVEVPPKKPEPVAIAPAFPGGAEAWAAFLRKDLYPPTTLREGEVKEALVQFLVATDGSVSNFKILQSAGIDFDKELLRVLKRTPNWKPAVENGRPVAATVTQRVVFVQRDLGENK